MWNYSLDQGIKHGIPSKVKQISSNLPPNTAEKLSPMFTIIISFGSNIFIEVDEACQSPIFELQLEDSTAEGKRILRISS